MSALLRPSASRASTSSWRAVSPAGLARVAGELAPGDAAHARLAQPGPEQRGHRPGVERVEQRERRQQVVGRPGVPQRQRPLVGLVRRGPVR